MKRLFIGGDRRDSDADLGILNTSDSELIVSLAPVMNLFRSRAHHLIDRLSDEELAIVWATLETLYCDLFMLRAVQEGQRSHNPGDTLTREEALDLMPLLQPAPRSL